MKLWLISQNENRGYDTYDSAVVAAKTADVARRILPCTISNGRWVGDETHGAYIATRDNGSTYVVGSDWAPMSKVIAELIGTALPGTSEGVILASFNAG